MLSAYATTGTSTPAGPVAICALVLDRRVVPVAVMTAALLTTTLPQLTDFASHRYEDTALESRPTIVPIEEPESIKRIRALGSREAGWDGPDSIGPTLATVKQAVAFARELHAIADLAQPYISLASDGEINFYWKTPRIELDLGFTGTGQYSYYGRTPDGIEFAEDGAELNQPLPSELISVLHA